MGEGYVAPANVVHFDILDTPMAVRCKRSLITRRWYWMIRGQGIGLVPTFRGGRRVSGWPTMVGARTDAVRKLARLGLRVSRDPR